MPNPPWLRTGPDPSPAEHARRSRRARVIAAVVSTLVQLPGISFALLRYRHIPGTDTAMQTVAVVAVVAVVVGVLAAAALIPPWRRAGVIVVAVLALPAIAYAPGPPAAALAVAIAVGRAVLGGAAMWAWYTLAGTGVAGVVWILLGGASQGSVRVLIVTVALCLLAGILTGVGTQRERFRTAAREERARRRSAAEEERLRIARELHDVLAHSLSQISVQAGVALHLFDDDPQAARETLRSIRATSVTALDDVRAVLGVLRDGDDPATASDAAASPQAERRPGPSLAGISGLLEDARASGLEVAPGSGVRAADVRSIAPPPATVQSAAYRIVQESLTNARRHAPGAQVAVDVHVDAEGVHVRVQNGPGRRPSESTGSGGRGVLGMRERATALGGTLHAAQHGEGGFVVDAWLPRPVNGTEADS